MLACLLVRGRLNARVVKVALRPMGVHPLYKRHPLHVMLHIRGYLDGEEDLDKPLDAPDLITAL